MLGGRFLVASAPLVTLSGIQLLRAWAGPAWRRRAAYGAVLALNVYAAIALAFEAGSPPWAFWSRPALPGHSFFETHHWDHRNFITSLEGVRAAVDLVHGQTHAPVVVLSKCAGVGFYYLAEERPGEVRFVNLLGLTTPDFARCSLTRDVRRDYLGVRLTYARYGEQRDELARVCDIPVADVVYDTYNRGMEPEREQLIESMGYRIVARYPNERAPNAGVLVAVQSRYLGR